MLRLPPVDPFSFWLGFGAAALLALLLFRARGALASARAGLAGRLRRLRELLTAGTERHLRDDVLHLAQTEHLAGGLFPLDDILLPPNLWVPAPPFDPTAPPADDGPASVIPLLADWPGLAALYSAPVQSAEAALAGGAGLLIVGAPGTGKTTLLAHLASRCARNDPALWPEPHIPLLVHAADLAYASARPDGDAQPDPAAALLAAAQARASAILAPRLAGFFRTRFRASPWAIFVDGADELPPVHVATLARWLAAFREAYPAHHVTVAAGSEGFGPLLAAGLALVRVTPFGPADYRRLLHRWLSAWARGDQARKRGSATADTDPVLLMGWLGSGNHGRSIFEVTLKVWAALAGDARGKRPVDALASYLARQGIRPVGERALQRLALAMLGRDTEVGLSRAEALAVLDAALAGPAGKQLAVPDDLLDDLLRRRVLARRLPDRIVFQHGLIEAFSAATALAVDVEQATPGASPVWNAAVRYLAPLAEITPTVAHRLGQAPDLLHSGLMAAAGWLRDAPPAARWRGEVLRRLSRLLLDTLQPETLRAMAAAALVASDEPSVAAVFKPGLAKPDPFTRRTSALCLGALQDPTAVAPLTARLADDYLDVRWAAALALGVIPHAAALEALAQALATGDDQLRRACAEALARNTEEGHALLREALGHDDGQVRRAAVYGLAAVNAPWVSELLQAAQHSEMQWLVRSAIQDVLAQRDEAAARAPQPAPPPHSLGWLAAWAAQRGEGVAPGPAAVNSLLQAASDGDQATQRAAAEALGWLGDPANARALYPLLDGHGGLLAETAFRALAQIANASGQRLAPAAF